MAAQKPIAVAVCSSKGGQMKSLLSACLAVRAMKDGRVAIIDWEPQGSLSIWWRLRGKPSNPHLHETKGDLAGDVAALKAQGYQTIIIDTPPMPMEPISRAIAAADVVLIPTRVGLFDIGGIRPVVGFAKVWSGRPFLFVLTGTNPDSPGWPKLIKEATAALKRLGGPVATKTIRERAVYVSAINTGKTGPEGSDKEAKAAAVEINSLWQAIKKQVRT